MLVISDTSVITGLLAIDHLWLLPEVFTQVTIPPAVQQELESLQHFGYSLDFFAEPWLHIQVPADEHHVLTLRETLGKGESEAIVLALEAGPESLLIIDEAAGRQIAISLNIQVTGLLGILIRAKQTGKIGDIKPLISALQEKIKFRISNSLLQQVLRMVNE